MTLSKRSKSSRIESPSPRLEWNGKETQSNADSIVGVASLYEQEIVYPRRLAQAAEQETSENPGISEKYASASPLDCYNYPDGWKNRLILGDSRLVLTSLLEKGDLREKVQTIYFDPPYGINFCKTIHLSNSRKRAIQSDSPGGVSEIKAYRDSWQDGISGYLSFMRDRLIPARETLNSTGSIFVQMGEENVHRIRLILDEIFGADNFVAMISYRTSGGFPSGAISRIGDYILWFAKDKSRMKYHPLFKEKDPLKGDECGNYRYLELPNLFRRPMTPQERAGTAPLPPGARVFLSGAMDSQGIQTKSCPVEFRGKTFHPAGSRIWTAQYPIGMERLIKANRIEVIGKNLRYVRYIDDYPLIPLNTFWADTGVAGFYSDKRYAVETNPTVIQRCILMASDPGDLVLDPACGSGTAADVAQQWGRRWIAIDTSQIAVSLTRSRLLGAKYPWYVLANSSEGKRLLAELPRQKDSNEIDLPDNSTESNCLSGGFVYQRAPHITVKTTGTNEEIDVIWNKFQPELERLRTEINTHFKKNWQDWEIPHPEEPEQNNMIANFPSYTQYWNMRLARQKEMDASIAARSAFENRVDKPYEDKSRLRCSSPFTVENLNSPLVDSEIAPQNEFNQMILSALTAAGINIPGSKQRVEFTQLTETDNTRIQARGLIQKEKRRAGICIAEQFSAPDSAFLTQAAEEAHRLQTEALFVLAFEFAPGKSEPADSFPIPVYRIRIKPDLRMSNELKNEKDERLFSFYPQPIVKTHSLPGDCVSIELCGLQYEIPFSEPILEPAQNVSQWYIDSNYCAAPFQAQIAYFPRSDSNPFAVRKKTNRGKGASLEKTCQTISRPIPVPAHGVIAIKIITPQGEDSLAVVIA